MRTVPVAARFRNSLAKSSTSTRSTRSSVVRHTREINDDKMIQNEEGSDLDTFRAFVNVLDSCVYED